MDATTAQATLLSAAKNFIRKSAGTAVVVIAPLAAVVLAPKAKAQSVFNLPVSGGVLSTSNVQGSFFSGSSFSTATYLGNGVTLARSSHFITAGISGGFSGGLLTLGLGTLSAVTPGLGLGASVDYTYNFTLTPDSGITVNSWYLQAHFTDGSFSEMQNVDFVTDNLGSTGNLTGSGTFFTPLTANDNYSVTLFINVSSSTNFLNLFITMSGGQGVTLNATPVPEPSTYAAIFGVGALCFVMVRRPRHVRAA